MVGRATGRVSRAIASIQGRADLPRTLENSPRPPLRNRRVGELRGSPSGNEAKGRDTTGSPRRLPASEGSETSQKERGKMS